MYRSLTRKEITVLLVEITAIMDRLRVSVLGLSGRIVTLEYDPNRVNVPCTIVKDAIREKCGKLASVLLDLECHALPWFTGERVVCLLPLRPEQLEVVFETKNKVDFFTLLTLRGINFLLYSMCIHVKLLEVA